MRRVRVYQNGSLAGYLLELNLQHYRFVYQDNYREAPVSLSMPTSQSIYDFDGFPPVFEGLLPEGEMLEEMLRREKIDRRDLLSQLICIGSDVVGSLQFEEDKT